MDDPLEDAADRAAETALAGAPLAAPIPSPAVPGPRRAGQHSEDQEAVAGETLTDSAALPRSVRIGRGPAPAVPTGTARDGAPLSPELRAYFEPRLGHDFSRVRVFHNAAAAAATRHLDAHAYTHVNNIAFAPGEYAPGTAEGLRLLAHELAHVGQQLRQGAGLLQRKPRRSRSRSEADLRREAIASVDWYYETRAAEPFQFITRALQLQADLAAPDASPEARIAAAVRLLNLADILRRRAQEAPRDTDGALLYSPFMGPPQPWSPERPKQVEDLPPFDAASVEEWRQIAAASPAELAAQTPAQAQPQPGPAASPQGQPPPTNAVAITFQKKEGMTFATQEGQQLIMLAVIAASRGGYSADQLGWVVEAMGPPRWAPPGKGTLAEWQAQFEALPVGESFTVVQHKSFIDQLDNVLLHAPSQRDFMVEGFRQGVVDAQAGMLLGWGTLGVGTLALGGGALTGSLLGWGGAVGTLGAGSSTPILTGGLAGRAATYTFLNAPSLYADLTLGTGAVMAGINWGERVRAIRGRGFQTSDIGGFALDATPLALGYGESAQYRASVRGSPAELAPATRTPAPAAAPQPISKPPLTGWKARVLESAMVGTLRAGAVRDVGAGSSRPTPALVAEEAPTIPATRPITAETPDVPAPPTPAPDVAGSRAPGYWRTTPPASANPAQRLPVGASSVSDLAERRTASAQAAEAVRQQAAEAAEQPAMIAVAAGGGGAPPPGAVAQLAGAGQQAGGAMAATAGPKFTRVDPGKSGTTPPTPARVAPSTITARPTGGRSQRDVDILEQRGMREQYRAYPGAEQHHVFPQQFRAWFEARFQVGHDIDEYTVFLDWGPHSAIHTRAQGGVRQGVQEPDLPGWNQEWANWIAANPNATEQEIFEQAGRLMEKYRISQATIDRYRARRR
jgi:hypothetical protein